MTDQPGWTPPTEPGAGGDPGPAQPGWGAPPGPPGQQGPPGQGWGPLPGGAPGWGQQPGAGWGQQPGAGWGQQPGAGWGQQPYGGMPWGRPAAPKPGVIPLRPLALSEILDGAFTVVREYPKVTLGLSAIVVTTTQLLSFAVAANARLSQGYGDPNSSFSRSGTPFSTASIVTIVIGAIGQVILAGMLTSVMGDAVLGRPTTIGETWRKVRPRFWVLIGAALVGGLVPFLGLIACIVPGVFLWGAWSFMTPAVVLERVGVRQSIRRSWRLAVPDWWRVFGVRALAVVIASVIKAVVVFPATLIAVGSTVASGRVASGGMGLVPLAVITIGGTIGGIITAPFTSGVLALLYIDRRMRSEGLDVTLAQTVAQNAAVETGTS